MRADKANLQKRFNADYVEEEFFGPKYVQSAFEFPKWPVITGNDPGGISLMNWGLIPSWVRDAKGAIEIRSRTVNARAETLYKKPAFRQAAVSHHCLILADGFFEFREVNGKKYPYFIHVGGRIFSIAGIYDQWADPSTGEIIPTFSVITTEANPLMEMIHNVKKRMPVILPEEAEKEWLQSGREGARFLKPFPDAEMEAWPVSRLITSRDPEKNSEKAQARVAYPELSDTEPSQGSLF